MEKPDISKFLYNDWEFIQGGTFQMGSDDGDDDEKPVHNVEISDFFISKYVITAEEYSLFLNETGNEKDNVILSLLNEWSNIEYSHGKYKARKGRKKHPMNEVSWYGAIAYAKWIGGNLPTEAQWEYSAGNGSKHTKWGLGNTFKRNEYIMEREPLFDIPKSNTENVDFGIPNDFGLYNMSGNVCEWCLDIYDSHFYTKITNPENPLCKNGTKFYVVRGGSWFDDDENDFRISYRDRFSPEVYLGTLGFRVVSY